MHFDSFRPCSTRNNCYWKPLRCKEEPILTGFQEGGEGSEIHVAKQSADLPTTRAINVPTAEDKKSLRKVAGNIPIVAYYLCAVEFAERASYYGVQPLFTQFVNKPLPADGNGYGAPKVRVAIKSYSRFLCGSS